MVIRPFLRLQDQALLYRPGHYLQKGLSMLGGHVRRVRELRAAKAFQVLYVYREATFLPSTWVEESLARRLPLLYDFDDAIYLPAVSAANAWARALKSSDKVERLCRLAAHVIVGNENLAAWARSRARAVSIQPSTIDTTSYRVADRPPNLRPVVGWTGSETTAAYLELLAPALRDLRERVAYEFRVIGATFAVDRVDVRLVPWRPESEVVDLQALDVGLMPLPDDEWARGKCGMKALQYMACGIPPVVSPVGVNAQMIQDGVTGLHARTPQEWTARILTLVSDADMRARIGSAARRFVEDNYSARVHVPRLAETIRALALHGRGLASEPEPRR